MTCEHNFVSRKSSRHNIGCGFNIYWSDITNLESGIELYVKRCKHFVAKKFYEYFGGGQKKLEMGSFVPRMERSANEARGDPIQMLEVQCAAYRVYAESLQNHDRSDMGNISLKVNWARRRVEGELIAAHKVNETWAGINIC